MNWFQERFELQRGGGGHNVRPMEGLRGLAVFLVFLVHYVTLGKSWISGDPVSLRLAKGLFTIGNTGVDLFFVLSGYLIYSSLIVRPQKFFSFMSRRVQRIYPAFLATFLLYIFLSFVFPSHSKIPGDIVAGTIYVVENLLLLPGLVRVEPMITVAWSLSYELFYYITIPVVITLLGLRTRNVCWRVSLFATLAVGIATYCAVWGGHLRLMMFISGILLYEAMNSRIIPSPTSAIGLLAYVLGLSGTFLPIWGFAGLAIKVSILFVSFFVLCLSCFRTPSAWLPSALSWTPLRWLGNMSYSYYLLHGLTLNCCFLVLTSLFPGNEHSPWLFWLFLPPLFLVTLVPTAALFLAIERPCSIGSPRTTRPAPTPLREYASNNSLEAVPAVSS